ncbi:unnamed protein product [Urochloa humidicola]
MAARTLALAAAGRARAAAARLQPLAPPLGRRFLPFPAASLLYPRAPPLLGAPRGPGASRLRPLAPFSFHPLAFSSDSTTKGVGGQDPVEGGGKDKGEKKRKEAARAAIDAGAKDGATKPGASAAEVPKKTHPDDASTADDMSKKHPLGDGGEKREEVAAPACAVDAGAKKPDAAAAELANKTHDPTAGEILKNQPPADGGEKIKKEAALAIDAGAKKPAAAAAELSNKTPPCPPTGKLPAPTDLSAILLLIQAQRKQRDENVLKGAEELLQRYM